MKYTSPIRQLNIDVFDLILQNKDTQSIESTKKSIKLAANKLSVIAKQGV